MKVLVLGLGNPILSDDGVGLWVTRELEKRLPGVDVCTTTMAGLDILDLILGYDQMFLIDACAGKGSMPGEIVKLSHEGERCLHLFSSHGLNFFEIFRLGKALGQPMPEVGGIYGIEIGNEICFGLGFSPQLVAKAGSIAEKICVDIRDSLMGDGVAPT